jgi:sulfite reductase (NADPH) flavoprotein alpha-component
MTIAALGLPLFGVTGWMLYLDRRRKKHAIARERIAISAASGAPVDDSVLIVFATQSGYAEQIALRTAAALHAAGVAVNVRSISRLGLEQLRHFRRALFVVSSFGDGDPPDSARPFMRQLMHQSGAALAHLHYGVLALGDRRYRNFCGYGHALDRRLQSRGARNRFAVVEVDNADPVALAQWQRPLADFCGVADIGMPIGATAAASPATAAAHYESWRLTERVHLNPGSTGEPIFHLALTPPEPGRQWRSGALVEILPRQTPQQVLHTLQETHMDGAAPVWFDGAQCTLAEALACTVLPTSGGPPPDAQSWVDSLQRLTPRRYSAASIAADQTLQLLVRQSTREGRLGLASGWLTAHAALGGAIDCRLLDNPGFALSLENAPAIFIGNGSGMAGLRSHLRARAPNRDGRRRNWLLLGERNRAHDFHYRDEIEQWQRDGVLARVDLAFSRDGSERIYVQDKLRQACASVREWVADGAVIYVCGSLEGMAAGVDATLGEILGADGLEQLIAAGRYRRDVY